MKVTFSGGGYGTPGTTVIYNNVDKPKLKTNPRSSTPFTVIGYSLGVILMLFLIFKMYFKDWYLYLLFILYLHLRKY